jgi:hypothetical protein
MNVKMAEVDDCRYEIKNPEIGQKYWVKCKSYRCIAILGNDGKWASLATGKEVAGILNVYPT